MSIILALESSAEGVSAALYVYGETTQVFERAPREHTRKLLPMVDSLLQDQGLTAKDLSAVAFSAGPGSFTGLRIGVGVAQGLAYANNLPVIPVSTPLAMAYGAYRKDILQEKDTALVAIDARMGEVYWACYQHAFPEPLALIAPCVRSTEGFEVSGDIPLASSFGLGSGWDVLPAAQTQRLLGVDEAIPEALDVALLGALKYARGECVSAADASPEYVRNTVSWKKRHEQ